VGDAARRVTGRIVRGRDSMAQAQASGVTTTLIRQKNGSPFMGAAVLLAMKN